MFRIILAGGVNLLAQEHWQKHNCSEKKANSDGQHMAEKLFFGFHVRVPDYLFLCFGVHLKM